MIDNLMHDDAMYAIAIEHGDYRRALVFALRGRRRAPTDVLWRVRVAGTWRRRRERPDA